MKKKTFLAGAMLAFSVTLCQAQTSQRAQPVAKETVHTTADVMPEFPGDVNDFLSKNVEYPKDALKRNVSGRVVVKIVVAEDGSVTDAKVERGVDPVLDAEALRAVRKMPKWRAGSINGKPVKVFYRIPVAFRLT